MLIVHVCAAITDVHLITIIRLISGDLIIPVILRPFASKPSDKVYCDSYDCPYGYYLIDDADEVECKWGKCKKSQCCERVCSSYKCPKHYTWKSGYEKIKCNDSGCTTDKCCKYHCES